MGPAVRLLSIYWQAGLELNAATGRYGVGQEVTLSLYLFIYLFIYFAAWRDACPGTSEAKAVSSCPEDVSESTLGSPRVEGQQGFPVPWPERNTPPLAL